jgi:nucleoside-diphosphate-sugar epimerase
MNRLVFRDAATPSTCLVLGGLGFIGSPVIDALLSRGYRVRCVNCPHVVALGSGLLDAPLPRFRTH